MTPNGFEVIKALVDRKGSHLEEYNINAVCACARERKLSCFCALLLKALVYTRITVRVDSFVRIRVWVSSQPDVKPLLPQTPLFPSSFAALPWCDLSLMQQFEWKQTLSWFKLVYFLSSLSRVTFCPRTTSLFFFSCECIESSILELYAVIRSALMKSMWSDIIRD